MLSKTKKENYIWASLTQIKKLSLIDNIINPFVKTILFMIQKEIIKLKCYKYKKTANDLNNYSSF